MSIYRALITSLLFGIFVCNAGCLAKSPLRFDEGQLAQPLLRAIWHVELYPLETLAYEPFDRAEGYSESGVYFVGGKDGAVRALRESDGSVLWRLETGDPVVARPLPVQKDLFVASMNGMLYRVDKATGTILWSYDTGSSIVSAPAESEGRVFVVNNKNGLFALDSQTGKFLWHKPRAHKTAFTMNGQGTPVVMGGKLFVGFSDGNLVCMALEDGATLWSRGLAKGDPRFSDVDATPWIENGRVYASSFSGGLYALDSTSGAILWNRKLDGPSAPVLHNGYLIVTTSNAEVVSVSKEDGSVRWTTRLMDGEHDLSAPTLLGGNVIVADGSALVALRMTTGRVAGKWTTGNGFVARPTGSGNALFAVSNSGGLYRFQSHDGR